MRIKEIYRGNTPPRDTDSVWIRGKEILLFTNEGWVNVNESTVVDTELNPESNHPIANSAVASSLDDLENAINETLGQAETQLSETSDNLIKNKAIYNQYITDAEIKEICEIISPTIYSEKYFTIENVGQTNLSITWKTSITNINYSLDDGATWNLFHTTLSVPVGGKVMLKHLGSSDSFEGNSGKQMQFGSSSAIIYGNIMSLLYGDNFKTQTSLGVAKQFRLFFYQNTRIASAENLVLPATTLTSGCYGGMFEQCTGLATPPKELPATTLQSSCYSRMFYGNTNMTTAPTIAATTLAANCCNNMFCGCTKLTVGPDLLAETPADNAYNSMFYLCNALTSIKCMLTSEFTGNSCTYYMLNMSNVSGLTRTLYKNPSASFWPAQSMGGTTWTIVDAS